MGPTAFHRVSAPDSRAERLIVSVYLQVIGMALLLASMTLVMFVVTRLIFDDTAVGLAFAAVAGGAGVLIWYVLPRVSHPDPAA